MSGINDCVNTFEEIITAAEKDSTGWYKTYEATLDVLVHIGFET
jgi:hypothetical protein